MSARLVWVRSSDSRASVCLWEVLLEMRLFEGGFAEVFGPSFSRIIAVGRIAWSFNVDEAGFVYWPRVLMPFLQMLRVSGSCLTNVFPAHGKRDCRTRAVWSFG